MPRRKYTRKSDGGHSRKWHGARFDEADYQLIVAAANEGDVGASDIIRRAAIREARRILRLRGMLGPVLAKIDARIRAPKAASPKLTRDVSESVRSDIDKRSGA